MTFVLTLNNLHLRDAGEPALLLDKLELPAGACLALTGLAPSNKSTLWQVLWGDAGPAPGTLTLFGHPDPPRTVAALGRLAYINEALACYPDLTVWANIRWRANLFGVPTDQGLALMEQLHLTACQDSPVAALDASGQRRLATALALLTGPELILCRDPLGQIDPTSRKLIGRALHDFVAAGGAILALVEEPTGALSYATQIGQLADGQLTWHPADQVSSQTSLRLTGRSEDGIVLVKPAELLYATVEQRQTWLYTTDRRLRSQASLSELQAQLAGHGFFRSHRAFLVNLQHVAEIITYTRDSYGIILADESDQQVPLSKQSYRELRDQLGL